VGAETVEEGVKDFFCILVRINFLEISEELVFKGFFGGVFLSLPPLGRTPPRWEMCICMLYLCWG